jgi:tetraacyldisaccharide 4'-kinase
MSFELFLQDIIKEKRRGFIPSLIKIPLKLLSFLYGSLVLARNWAYDYGWFKQYTPPIPVVISIGNITAGGTGKTPVALLFAKLFENDVKVAIASRGYRSRAEHRKTPVVVSSGMGPQYSVALCGDEPYLLAENLRKTNVYVGKNRIMSANMAAQAGVQLLILEDGMQHRKLARDLDIVVLDGRDPFGKGHFLPYGMLRDSVNSLARASMIVVNHVKDSGHYNVIKALVANHSQAPLVGFRVIVEGVYDLLGNIIEISKGQKVGTFCGIANPEQFFQTVESLGPIVIAKKAFPDHTLGDARVLKEFAEKCGSMGATLLLCSEKDKVKLQQNLDLNLPVGWVKISLEIVEGEENWKNLIENVKKKLDSRSIR